GHAPRHIWNSRISLMQFWKPTRKKLSTALFLVALWISYTTICNLATKAHKAYSLELLSSGNYGKSIEEPTKEYVQATQDADGEITLEMVEKLEWAGYMNISAQIVFGLLMA